MEGLKFVKEPPDDYSCMICAKLLDEPHLTDCCGQHFCQLCLERWFEKQGKKLCPHCRSESFTHMRYLPLKRKIDSVKVYCTYQERGCTEFTTVGQLKSHQDGCGFAPVACSLGCGVEVLRKELDRHCNKECLNRRIRCKYCGEEDQFKTITGRHMSLCSEYPVDCPKGCALKTKLKRKDLVAHSKVCPLVEVVCDFHKVGCDIRVLRKDLDAHLEASTQLHLRKVMSCCSQLTARCNQLTTEQIELKDECKRLSSQVEMLTLAEPVKLSEENSSFTFNIPSGEGWISPPFYILDVYKLCIKHKHGNEASLLLLKAEEDGGLKRLVDLKYRIEVCVGVEQEMLKLPLRKIQESTSDSSMCLVTTVKQSKELATMILPHNSCGKDITVELIKASLWAQVLKVQRRTLLQLKQQS